MGAAYVHHIPIRYGEVDMQGKPAERFIYLSWGDVDASGEFHMFRRAKLHVSHLDAAALDGATVRGELALSDNAGGPRCASLRPPDIAWTID